MVSEEELRKFHPLDRARIRQLSSQLDQKISEHLEITKRLAYKNKLIDELSERIEPYNLETPLDHFEHEKLEEIRKQLVLERNEYDIKSRNLQMEIESLTNELSPFFVEKPSVGLKTFAIPILLMIIVFSAGFFLLSNFRSTTGYIPLSNFNLANSLLGLIFLVIIIAISMKFLK